MENLRKREENWQHDAELYKVLLVHLGKIITSNVTWLSLGVLPVANSSKFVSVSWASGRQTFVLQL